ncbi:hypothetical protein H6F77_14625 [Microcoleus sp. FACHB-831]|uniref:hypothetical protein n=1 Tax=Microcoleus sp. FACHB-831 TaxID=2692827 RepID=UPI001685EF74|nr:hypothetical protein [Microcoleus sp. FACHB-831]MBD1922308.1 hypothetical protein [Microcoleus sp. FACHB-831]
MFQLLYFLVHAIQPILVPVCFLCAWMLTILFGWSIWTAIADTQRNAKRMHSIPCAECKYFTGDYHLKCTVQPYIAMSPEAIDCPDYRPEKFTCTESGERAY